MRLVTLDLVEDWNNLDGILVFDFPEPAPRGNKLAREIVLKISKFRGPKFLVLHECEVIKPNNWIQANHEDWSKIFTWHDAFIDNVKYIKLNMPPRRVPEEPYDVQIPPNFAVMIASNKKVKHKKELYSERLKCIQWYEFNRPEAFDLYGVGWDCFAFRNDHWVLEKFNRLKPLTKILSKNFSVWQGTLEKKEEIAGKYKFHFAYENAKEIPGYILEKFFDAILLRSIPIYFGANNIQDHIPSNCYIDARNFDSYQSLDKFLRSISDYEIVRYLESAQDFIRSPSFYPFSVERYVETLMRGITQQVKQGLKN